VVTYVEAQNSALGSELHFGDFGANEAGVDQRE